LPPEDREINLVTAYRNINLLRLRGTPVPAWGYAQILEAFELSKPNRAASAERQARGVRSVSIGGASESYDTSYSPNAPETFGVPLLSARAYRLLRPYIIAGAVIV